MNHRQRCRALAVGVDLPIPRADSAESLLLDLHTMPENELLAMLTACELADGAAPIDIKLGHNHFAQATRPRPLSDGVLERIRAGLERFRAVHREGA